MWKWLKSVKQFLDSHSFGVAVLAALVVIALGAGFTTWKWDSLHGSQHRNEREHHAAKYGSADCWRAGDSVCGVAWVGGGTAVGYGATAGSYCPRAIRHRATRPVI